MVGDQRRLDWDERHKDGDFEGRGPNPTLVAGVAGLRPGRALELACGSGTNAVWLAGQGWQTTAVDWSPVGLANGQEKAEACRRRGRLAGARPLRVVAAGGVRSGRHRLSAPAARGARARLRPCRRGRGTGWPAAHRRPRPPQRHRRRGRASDPSRLFTRRRDRPRTARRRCRPGGRAGGGRAQGPAAGPRPHRLASRRPPPPRSQGVTPVTVKTATARYDGTGLRFTARTGSGHEIVLDDAGRERRPAARRDAPGRPGRLHGDGRDLHPAEEAPGRHAATKSRSRPTSATASRPSTRGRTSSTSSRDRRRRGRRASGHRALGDEILLGRRRCCPPEPSRSTIATASSDPTAPTRSRARSWSPARTPTRTPCAAAAGRHRGLEVARAAASRSGPARGGLVPAPARAVRRDRRVRRCRSRPGAVGPGWSSTAVGRPPGRQRRHARAARSAWTCGENLTPFPEPLPGARLVESGAYRLVRHPIYGGLILGALGWGLLTASPLALARRPRPGRLLRPQVAARGGLALRGVRGLRRLPSSNAPPAALALLTRVRDHPSPPNAGPHRGRRHRRGG